MYTPVADVESILQYGYCSVRVLHERWPETFDRTIVHKYLPQAIKAAMDYPELAEYWKSIGAVTEIDRVVAYCDWREDETLQGAKSIYVLFAPIPEELHEQINAHRYQFLSDTRLLELYWKPEDILHQTVINDVYSQPASWYYQQDAEFWKQLWLTQLHDNPDAELWLEGIPHVLLVASSGQVCAKLPVQ